MNTGVVTAHIPNELAEQIDQLSARLDRPKGWIVKQALTSWVALEVKRHQLTLEGMADVDAGCLSITLQLTLGLQASTSRYSSWRLNGRIALSAILFAFTPFSL